jgi:hypothetical protein
VKEATVIWRVPKNKDTKKIGYVCIKLHCGAFTLPLLQWKLNNALSVTVELQSLPTIQKYYVLHKNVFTVNLFRRQQ